MKIIVEKQTTVSVNNGTLMFVPVKDKTIMQISASKYLPGGGHDRVEFRLTSLELGDLGSLLLELAGEMVPTMKVGV